MMSDLSPDQWREDLRYLVGTMLIAHRDLFHRIDREVFRERVRALERTLPSLSARCNAPHHRRGHEAIQHEVDSGCGLHDLGGKERE